jgi:hypothetical protein
METYLKEWQILFSHHLSSLCHPYYSYVYINHVYTISKLVQLLENEYLYPYPH